ncbi:hypothetical protein PoB_005563200 [Plakobranchus ocellatus]|uniref:Sulfotransferase domain-containing protein n=1 Tax=Plakobranchus ocellatus TaxID=259542 RepID=A0AAV4CC45_9GAST|nr:hypothetical protein PoB_005563200 [Plakobranchus ocellatus]
MVYLSRDEKKISKYFIKETRYILFVRDVHSCLTSSYSLQAYCTQLEYRLTDSHFQKTEAVNTGLCKVGSHQLDCFKRTTKKMEKALHRSDMPNIQVPAPIIFFLALSFTPSSLQQSTREIWLGK